MEKEDDDSFFNRHVMNNCSLIDWLLRKKAPEKRNLDLSDFPHEGTEEERIAFMQEAQEKAGAQN